MSLGENRVRVKFNPSDSSLVNQIKQKTAELINLCNEAQGPGQFDARLTREQAEIVRCWSLAMTHYEDAAMWAVKAATTQPEKQHDQS